ncbi:hypothetical protein CLV51_10479 [Chitinophaga niastensis]|uniref:ABC-2 family transporter n=1 Tax=Chitinophaga niastensis TaxID=536980 RepID=A0A2P8HGN4_CHINA|nr:ABC transporter permease [Chitinophaga niastensis]PSL45377.1 hypothetical protein CLV51_10479 [Chitinophaga niastensis]
MGILFLSNVQAELLKTKRTAALWLTLLAAAFVPAINCLICLQRPDIMMAKFKVDPWLTFLRFNWKNTASAILPLFVILLTSLLLQIEYRNATWKQVYAMPRKYADIFFSKFLVIQALIIGFLLLFNVFMLTSAFVIHSFQPGYAFYAGAIPWDTMAIQTTRIYTGILGVAAIQYWLSTRFRNFTIPLGTGMGLWIAGLILMDWDKIIYYPYMYTTLFFVTDFSKHPDDLSTLLVSAVACFIVAILLGFRNIYQLKAKG